MKHSWNYDGHPPVFCRNCDTEQTNENFAEQCSDTDSWENEGGFVKDLTPEQLEEFDPVNKPKHYNSHPSGIEVLEITRHMGFLDGNIIKYVMRAPYKGNEIQDLEKALFYLNQLIRLRKGEPLR